MNKRQTWIFSVLFFLLLGAGNLVIAAPPAAAGDDINARQINDLFILASSKANPSVVTIASERVVQRSFRHPFFDFWGDDFGPFGPAPESRSRVLGSGVIINASQGYIVTNHHVIEDAEDIEVMLIDRRELSAKVVGTDPSSDIAVIKVEIDNLQQAQVGNSDDLRIGEWVLAIGSPFSPNLDHTVTAGIVSAKSRSDVLSLSSRRYEDFIQTDAAINPGNSGGALVNLNGELVGINTAIATNGFSRSSAGVGFAIPINLVMRVVDDLIEYGKVTRAYLGVLIQDVDASLAKALDMKSPEGAIVNEVHSDTPAEKAGIKEGDVIIRVDDIAIRDNSHLRNVISSSRPGDRRKVVVIRDGKEKTITVKLGELPSEETLAARDNDRDEDETVQSRTGFAVAELDSREAQQFDVRAEEGVLVTRINPRSKAARGGVQPGDVVVKIDDVKISDLSDYRRALKDYKEGDTVLLRIVRGEVFLYVGLELS
ncbi:MAG: Do family serine endopeptidase [Fidelibacterota bacterium]|nr:MAG: Do family serine endopeptidase [Candidatus Neomarinimicrobiota bacterium]